ncbi:MAG: GAF domain-containing protein [Kouleothrix sp.]|nr:GAF domain-containing protein [Kouleothrix sp.]
MTAWRNKLALALSGNTAQLIRSIPDLAQIIEAPSDVASEASDPKVLLALALQGFLRAIAEPDHPLVVFLDDAQWADAESWQLVQQLTNDSDLCLLVICAYREDDAANDRLQGILSSVRGSQHLALAPLDLADTGRFLADALHAAPEQVRELAALMHAKTNGNAFFLREFLRSLHDRSLVSFDPERRAWQWNLAQIRAAPITDNVVELVRGRLQQLPAQAQKTLKIAAIMGSRFEIGQLAVASQQTSEAISKDVQLALELDAVVPLAWNIYRLTRADQPSEPRRAAMEYLAAEFLSATNRDQVAPFPGIHRPQEAERRDMPALSAGLQDTYEFAHAQIREAATLLLPALAEEAIHRQIGRGLLQSMTPAQREEHIFLLVRHLNQASTLPADWFERVELAGLNLQAGRRALALVAFDNAYSLATGAIAILEDDPPGDAWRDASILMRDLHLTAAQAASRGGQFEQSERLLGAIAERSTSALDHAAAAQVRMFGLFLQGKHAEAVVAAVHALRQLGVRLPQHAGNRQVLVAVARTRLALLGKRSETLDTLPPMTDERSIMAMEIMASASISAGSVNPRLLSLIGLEIVRQTLKHGSHPLSAMGYALYGLLLCGVGGQIDRGYAFGQLAMRLAPQIRNKEYRVFVKYFVYAHINHWKEHIQATLQPLRDLTSTGEFEYLVVAAGVYPYFTWFISGLDIGTNERAFTENMYLLEPFKGTPVFYRYQLGHQYYQNLLGWSDNASQLVGKAYDERAQLPIHLQDNDRATIFYLACHKLVLCYLYENYVEAEAAAQLARQYSDGGIGTPLVPVLYFYDSLAHLARYPAVARAEARRILKAVAANQRKLRAWARYGPANCAHRHSLVEAELARALGENGKARELYDAAVKQAQEHEYLPELSVAHEAAARFYLSLGQPAYAGEHLRAAHRTYQTWGALGKARQIETRYPQLFPGDSLGFADLSAYLDMTSVLRAAQVLSSETALPRLMDKLTSILIENAGAQYGCLLLPEGRHWRVAGGEPAAAAGDTARSGAPDQPPVAMSIVRQVARTREPLLLNNVATAALYAQDPHLSAAQPRSILCLPLLHKGELVGVFYMEHRLTSHAFPPERLELLTMLATQAAIALQNASLVAGLQEAQDSVQASEQRFRLLFEHAPLGIFEIDISDAVPRIRAANRRAEATYGWSSDELASLDAAQLIPDESRDQIQRMVESVRSGKTAQLETTNRRRDGTLFPVRIIATPARAQRGLRMIVAVEDITAQRQRRSEAEAIDEERRRIAQEVHDGVAQDMASLRLKLSLWRDWIARDPDRMQGELDQTRDMLDAAIDEIRRSIYALRPVALDEVGLLIALRRYVAGFNEEHKLYVDLQINVPQGQAPIDLELPLFRATQEALNNIAQHAEASLAWVRLDTSSGDAAHLTIRDNGQGFDVATLAAAGRSGHFGLKQMHERIEKAGGTLTVFSQPGQGTQLQIWLPLAERSA